MSAGLEVPMGYLAFMHRHAHVDGWCNGQLPTEPSCHFSSISQRLARIGGNSLLKQKPFVQGFYAPAKTRMPQGMTDATARDPDGNHLALFQCAASGSADTLNDPAQLVVLRVETLVFQHVKARFMEQMVKWRC